MKPRPRFRERGQVVVLSALLLPILLGMTGMAVDVGAYANQRRQLQNSADSIALAAAQELPDEGAARAKADEWATKNDVLLTDMTVIVSGGNVAPQVRVSVEENHRFSFVKILGIDNKDVNATATAAKVSFGGSNGIVPWAVTQDTVDTALAMGDGVQITLKYDTTGGNLGNFGAMRIDGPGSSVYNTSVKYGSTTYACAETAVNCVTGACPGTYPATCAETSPECDGPDCSPQTGNVIGPTRTGVDFRLGYTMPECDTFTETFGTPDAGGIYDLNPTCNPWTEGPGKCDSNTDICSRRVIIIPVVDSFGNGQSSVTIQRFALVYLEGYEGTCTGNSCDILGRFVQAELTTRALAGLYDEDALIHFVRLTE